MQSKIASVVTHVVRYASTAQFKFLGQPGSTRDTVLVKITDDGGRVGWGQSVPSRTWSYETVESVQTTIDGYLGPALIGLDAFDRESIQRVMDRTIAPSFSTGQPICKAGIDLALFDLTGRILGQTAAQRWNRTGRGSITLSWTIDARSIDEVAPQVALAHERGYHHFNLKVGTDADYDVRMCREVRRLAPQAFIWADANCGYDLETALAVAPKMADLGITALEQPCPSNRLSWYRRLRSQRALPILMDEPIVSLADLQEFHVLEMLDGVAMKVARCGGLSEARKILEYVEQNGLLFFASGLTDPDVSLAASLLLLGAFNLERPAALNASQFLAGTVLKVPLEIHGDQAYVPSGPGLGVDVDETRLAGIGNEPRGVEDCDSKP